MDKIKVAVKVRPFVPREKGCTEFWRVTGNELHVLDNNGAPTGEKFAFDHVFGKLSTNSEVFEQVVKPLVDSAVRGFNATIFAYGQTSSGKTHTMLGDGKEPGVTQLAVSSMFDFMKKSAGREFLVRASYMEIYNEKVNDLLQQKNANLKIREEEGRIVVSNLKEELVADTAKVMNLLKRGQSIRRIGETNLNEKSSRSHTIFRMIIESRVSDNGDDEPIQVSQLNLVDLAGSERAGQAGTAGERLKEGCAINRSLFQLSNVVSQLSEGSQFVNFRDSKLTRILQPSLGGNARTLIICAVTPASMEFTISTLGFASRAKAVKNKPQVNEVMSDGTLLKKYARQLEKLQAELKAAKERNSVYELEAVESKLEEQERLNDELQQRINVLMKTLIVSERTIKPRPNRRRTWGGQMDLLKPTLGTIPEIMETSLVLVSDADFNTPYEDFEVQLIEDEREKCSELDTSPVGNASSQSLALSSFESSIVSNRTSIMSTIRESSISPTFEIFKEEAGVQTSPAIADTPIRGLEDSTPQSVLRSNIAYLEKEYKELDSFTRHEKDLIWDLEKQLRSKEEQCQELCKNLSEKEEILRDTLSLQESLTHKLIEYENTSNIGHQEINSSEDSNKLQELVVRNNALETQLKELQVHYKACGDQLDAFKDNLCKEVTSLNANYSQQTLENSEPSDLLHMLMG